MAWWDDFAGEIQDIQESSAVQDINQYLKDNPSTLTLVKSGLAQTGNQTAAQIAAGIPGGGAPVAKPASQNSGVAQAAIQNGAGSGLFKNGKVFGMSAGLALMLGVGAFFLLSKKGN